MSDILRVIPTKPKMGALETTAPQKSKWEKIMASLIAAGILQ